jgi:hypothetical protein
MQTTRPTPAGPRFHQRLPLEAYLGLGAPWLHPLEEFALFAPDEQERMAAAFRSRHLAPWDPGFLET